MTNHQSADRIDGAECTITIARSVDEIEALRDAWQRLQWHPNADIDFFITIVKARPEIVRPHVFLLCRDGMPETLMVGRIEDIHLECKFGYRTLYRPKVRVLTIVEGGIAGQLTPSNAARLVQEIRLCLAEGDADFAKFDSLKVQSALYSAATTQPNFLQRDRITVPSQHWKLTLADSYEEFRRGLSKRVRNNLRYYANKLKKKYADGLEVKCYGRPEDLDRVLFEAEAIARRTYHRGLGAGFENNAETRRWMKLCAERGWLRAYVAYVDGKPSAFWHGLRYGETFYTGNTGYDPDYTADRLGTFLLNHVIESLCEDASIGFIDFGQGDAEYKRIFCNENWPEASVLIAAPTLRAVTINSLRTPIIGLSQAAKWVLTRSELLSRFRRTWRRRLTAQSKGA